MRDRSKVHASEVTESQTLFYSLFFSLHTHKSLPAERLSDSHINKMSWKILRVQFSFTGHLALLIKHSLSRDHNEINVCFLILDFKTQWVVQ